uniref:Chloride intracellular channel exl-1 n=2 Tax=Panagrolaimus sp. JU765 TaxID=591449 RepID=A0AC34QDB4_9BILA
MRNLLGFSTPNFISGDDMSEKCLKLWLKAGSDGESVNGDPLSQQLFMMLLLKGDKCPFNVITINEAKPPPEFKNAGFRHAPAIQQDEDCAYSHPDEIVEYIESRFPDPDLKSDEVEADAATADLFRAFCFFVKEVNKDPKGLLNELYRLDQFLSSNGHQFLTAETPKLIDCNVLPKLHSIRIASRALKNFEIPADLHNLWRYLHAGYQHKAFKTSCPSDQEIILYWADRKDTADLPPSKRTQLSRQEPVFTLTVPPESLKSK